MSQIQDDRAVGLDDIFLREIKDKIDSAWRLQRQLERCNILAAQATDEYRLESFRNSVDMTIGDLPQSIKAKVEEREDEYTEYYDPQPRYLSRGGIRIGTVENPVTDDEGSIISPIISEVPPETDYVKKLEIIKEELEVGGASWGYKKAGTELPNVLTEVPEHMLSEIEKILADAVIRHREIGAEYSWADLLWAIQQLTPELPMPPSNSNTSESLESSPEA